MSKGYSPIDETWPDRKALGHAGDGVPHAGEMQSPGAAPIPGVNEPDGRDWVRRKEENDPLGQQ